jgi:HAD superfamily hydrolase (TIGR01549 family)
LSRRDLQAAFARAGIDPTRLDTVFLDAGGVLANPNWERVVAALARHGIEIDAQVLASAEPHAKRELDDPERVRRSDDRARSQSYWGMVAEHAGLTAAPELLARAWLEIADYHRTENLWESIISGVPEALDELRAMGLKLVVVSNANGTLRAKLERLGLASRLDVILDSHELGVEKPDRRIFEIALERGATAAGRVVHVGDFYEIDVAGARAAGLPAVLIDSAGLYVDRDEDCPRAASLLEFVRELSRLR